MTAPVAMTDAIPLMQPGGTVGQNNAADIRKGLLNTILIPSSLTTARQGVIATTSTGIDQIESLRVRPLASAGLGVRINGGRCVINKTGEGPYLIWMEAATTQLNLAAAHATLRRYDAVVVRLVDRNIAADSGSSLHGAYFDKIEGTAGASFNPLGAAGSAGAYPIIPTGCLLLAYIERTSGSAGDTINTAQISLARKGTSLYGTPRLLLESDSSSEAGSYIGEARMYKTLSLYDEGPDVHVWDGVEWRGTQTRVYTVIGSHGDLTVPATIASLNIPDPGCRYKIVVAATAQAKFVDSASGDRFDLGFRVGSTSAPFYILNNIRDWNGGAGTRFKMGSGSRAYDQIITGSTTIYLRADFGAGSGTYVNTSSGEPYVSSLTVTVVPA